MIGFAITAASGALIALVIGAGLFLKDYGGAKACVADRAHIEKIAEDNHQRWQTAASSAEASCRQEIASATKLARQEAALDATKKALAAAPVDAEGECGLDSEIRWDK